MLLATRGSLGLGPSGGAGDLREAAQQPCRPCRPLRRHANRRWPRHGPAAGAGQGVPPPQASSTAAAAEAVELAPAAPARSRQPDGDAVRIRSGSSSGDGDGSALLDPSLAKSDADVAGFLLRQVRAARALAGAAPAAATTAVATSRLLDRLAVQATRRRACAPTPPIPPPAVPAVRQAASQHQGRASAGGQAGSRPGRHRAEPAGRRAAQARGGLLDGWQRCTAGQQGSWSAAAVPLCCAARTACRSTSAEAPLATLPLRGTPRRGQHSTRRAAPPPSPTCCGARPRRPQLLEELRPGLGWRVFAAYPEQFGSAEAAEAWRLAAAMLYTEGGLQPHEARGPCPGRRAAL